ncbi:MAG: DUF488 domain-containing protein [Christensenellaceae bacterium]|jgi:uncharacterized protein (DUF488 family)|nr:DUF488 domain-containing protein [Christensenellaceae bacterium]
MQKVYTIGYAGITPQKFLEVLKENEVTLLIDVRSMPKSRYFANFNDNVLLKELPKHNIKYENWQEFGARQLNFNYDTIANSEPFKKAINRVKASTDTICLMCAEIDPINCHRAILAGRYLDNLTNIIAKRNGEIIYETKAETEKRFNGDYERQGEKISYKQ